MPINNEAEMARTLNKLIIVDIEEGYRVPVRRKRQEISDMLAENRYNDPEVWQALMDYDILLGELLQRYEEVENVMEHLFEYYLTLALHSVTHTVERELRVVGDYNMVTLYKIDNELLNLKMMYEYLIENFNPHVVTKG